MPKLWWKALLLSIGELAHPYLTFIKIKKYTLARSINQFFNLSY